MSIVEAQTELSVVEQAKLENLESVIEGGLKSFLDVGRALTEIRDGKLYRQSHVTFENYCRDRWKLERAHAYRLIDAAEVIEAVSPVGDIPTSERQARPLTKLDSAEEKRAAWQEALETAPEGKVTAKHVAEVVNKRLGKTPVVEAEPEPEEEGDCPKGGDHDFDKEACRKCHEPKPKQSAPIASDKPRTTAKPHQAPEKEVSLSSIDKLIERIEGLINKVDSLAAQHLGHNEQSRALNDCLRQAIKLSKAMGRSWRNV